MNKNQLQELVKELSAVSESLKGSYLLSARLASQDNESYQEQTHLYKVCHERCIKFIESLNELASEQSYSEAIKEGSRATMKEVDKQIIEQLTERFESRKKEIFKVIKGNDEDWLSMIGRRVTRILDGGDEVHFYTEGNDTPMMIAECNVGFKYYPCDPIGNENMTYVEYLPSGKDELHTLLLESRDILTELKRCGHFYFSAIELTRYIENPINGEDLEKHIDKLLDAINDKYHQNQS